MTTVDGYVVINSRGFGFLKETSGDSHFIPPNLLKNIFLDDYCEAEIENDKLGRTKVVEMSLIERRRETVFGQIKRRGRSWFLVPDPEVCNHDLKLTGSRKRARANDWALVEVNAKQQAQVATVFGSKSRDQDRDIARITSKYALSQTFPEEVEKQVETLRKQSKRLSLKNRRDLRKITTITVDAPSTTDIDDAISILPADDKGGLRLLVSIADPTESFDIDSPLDREAQRRATSVYLIGHVIPMLPRALSEDLFSLLPKKDRYALTAEMRIDPEGQISAVDIYESVIRSDARVSYKEAYSYLRGLKKPRNKKLAEAFAWFRTASSRLAIQRRLRGGVANPHVEPKVELDEDSGKPNVIVARPQNSAHQMIERFMVAANESVARWLNDRGCPTLFRCHPVPDPERVQDLIRFAKNFGVEPGLTGELTPRSLAAFADQAREAPIGPAFFSVLMKCLGRAYYTPEALGHFGLASEFYSHFTSPIRRYADMLVHRVLKAYLRGQRADLPYDGQALQEQAENIARCEQVANWSERDHQRIIWARYLADKIGQSYDANVTRVAAFGVFVQLTDSRIQGLIPAESLGRKTHFDPERKILRSGRQRFEIGQALRVKVESTDPATGSIEFKRIKRR